MDWTGPHNCMRALSFFVQISRSKDTQAHELNNAWIQLSFVARHSHCSDEWIWPAAIQLLAPKHSQIKLFLPLFYKWNVCANSIWKMSEKWLLNWFNEITVRFGYCHTQKSWQIWAQLVLIMENISTMDSLRDYSRKVLSWKNWWIKIERCSRLKVIEPSDQ